MLKKIILFIFALLLVPLGVSAAVVRSGYVGEASPGWLVDSYSANPDLTPVASASNPSSPTPPQGSKWLFYSATDTSSGMLQSSAFSGVSSANGCLQFYYRTGSVAENMDAVALVATGGDYQSNVGVFINGSTMIFRNNYASYGGAADQTYPTPLVADTTYKIRIQWTGGQVTYFVNGVSFATVTQNLPANLTQLKIGASGPNQLLAGTEEYIDAVMISDDPNDQFVAVFGTPTNTPSPTATATKTASATSTGTPTFTRTHSPTATPTGTPTFTRTASPTGTPTRTATKTNSPTPTKTITPSITLTFTKSPTPTRSVTPSNTVTPSVTKTNSPSPTRTISATLTQTPIATPTMTPGLVAVPENEAFLKWLFNQNGTVNFAVHITDQYGVPYGPANPFPVQLVTPAP